MNPVRIAIVPRKCRGQIWIDDPESEDGPDRMRLETPSVPGVRIELETLLNRYVGRDVQIDLWTYEHKDSVEGIALVHSILPFAAIVHSGRDREPHIGRPYWDPLLNDMACEVLTNFRPPWYEDEERMILMSSIDMEGK